MGSERVVCPTCKKGDQIYENNTIEIRLLVKDFDEEGEPTDFDYPFVTVDDTIATSQYADRWHCGHCGEDVRNLFDVQNGKTFEG